MPLTFARILPASANDAGTWSGTEARPEGPRFARIEPRAVVESAARARDLVARAEQQAAAIVERARAEAQALREHAVQAAQAEGAARLAADLLALQARDDSADVRALDRSVELARLLAERLLGEALVLDPTRIEAIARRALVEASGARRIRILAHPSDAPALERALGGGRLQHVVEILADGERARGSLRFESEIGILDADLAPQLDRLAARLRQALHHDD
jgi:flagellar biosynthesis/type III secretory pathway protein FliH